MIKINDQIQQPTIDVNHDDYCEKCDLVQDAQVKNIKETYSVRGEDIVIDAVVKVCGDCEKPIFDERLDSENIKKAFEKYSLINDILSPAQIVEIRNKYGLSQRGLANLLSWSSATVARYEKGSIPTSSHHRILINLKENVDFTKQLFRNNKDKLGKLDLKRMDEKLSQIENQLLEIDTILLLSKKYRNIKDPLYNGFIDFEFTKLANIVAFFSNKVSRISKTKLMKLLFYADFKHYKAYGLSISGIPYKHLPFGPVPDHHWLMLEALTENEIIEMKPFEDYEGEYIEAIEKPDSSFFDTDEIEIMESVAINFESFNAEQISDYSHMEEAYRKTKDREYISYDYADSLRDFT